MWKEYSKGYLKNNRASGLSVMIAAFISALLLSLLCGLFYNLWKYEVERIEQKEGGWQSRITGGLREEEIAFIENLADVKKVVINKKEVKETEVQNGQMKDTETVIDIYFYHYKKVLEETPQIAAHLGIPPEMITYHYELLAMYLIRDPQDSAPRLLFPMFLLIMAMASFSLIIIIHNAFAVTMNARIHQFGIFASIGATPKQIRTCLIQEAAALCILPVIAGNLLGIGIGMGILQMSNVLLGNGTGRHKAVFGYHPLVLLLTLLVTGITIWISAWLPARKLSRLMPLEAIKNTGELQLKRKKGSPILALLFGMEGELAKNALRAQRKSLRTATLSLLFSFMAFTIMQCFFTTSEISTRETYFERYQDAWDIMAVVKDAGVDSFAETAGLQGLPGVESAVVYQKAMAKRIISEEEMSEEMKGMGGFSHDSGNYTAQTDGGWLVNAPVVILDDAAFLAYCAQIGVTPRLDGAVVRNQIRDVTNPDFRHPKYMPYIKADNTGENAVSVLLQSGKEEMTEDAAAEVPVLAYTDMVPVLREEYATLDYYELVHFVPVSLWKEIKEQIGGMEENINIRILGREGVTSDELNALQSEIEGMIGQTYEIECENRIQEYDTNNKQIQGMKIIFGAFCVLLAIIGIGNVFSNTLGFVRQRKREFARYMSVGLTPEEIRKMFCIEALVIAGRPVLFTFPPAVLAVRYMLRASYLEAKEFLAEAPFCPIIVFLLAIVGTVAFSYYLGWRNVRRISLAEVLRDDTMM